MNKVLVFVASGLSTRMGGSPKGLSILNDTPVIINAIRNARPFFDSIYIVSNHMTKGAFNEALVKYNCGDVNLRSIVTGKGDAESVLKSLNIIEEENNGTVDVTFCWGDAFFPTNVVFQEVAKFDIDAVESILVACSVDENPYAYFDFYTKDGNMNQMYIKKSYFFKKNGPVPIGMHDQCVFRCNSSRYLNCLAQFRKKLGYDGNDYKLSATNEMGLLYSFDFLNEIGIPAIIKVVPSGSAFSFNTVKELNEIQNILSE